MKLQQMMKIFLGVNQGTGYLLPIYEKNRVQKSHATVPLNGAINIRSQLHALQIHTKFSTQILLQFYTLRCTY